MKLLRAMAALLCAGMLCLPVSAEGAPEDSEIPAVTEQTPAEPTVLQIDNTHVYEHMQQCYADGYEPISLGGYAVIVLPLACTGGEKPPSLRMSVEPEPGNSPFVIKNYECTVPLGRHAAEDGSEQEIYLAEFWLTLAAGRVNGCYPVHIRAGEFGSYTIYFNVTDGIDPNAEAPAPPVTEPPEEPVILQPKILVQGITGGEITAGESAELHITLKNTSHTEALQNLTVTAAAPDCLTFDAAADTLYFEQVAADAEFEAVLRCRVRPDAPAGSYDLPLQFDFAYDRGMSGGGSGKARIAVTQPVNVEFPQVVFPAEAVVTDRLELHLQALNLGKSAVYNVRAELSADGLLPEGAAFIGDVAGGTAADAVLNVQVSSKRGAEAYGETSGQILFTYTDETGTDHTEAQDFSLMLKSPFSERAAAPEQADSRAWVWIMAGICGGILLLAGLLFYRGRRGRT